MGAGRLDLTAKLYQPAVLPAVRRVALGSPLPAPLVVDLDPTSFCDLACPECISGRLLNQTRFTTERLKSLAEELVELDVKAVVLIGGGEPLGHRGTRSVLEILGTAGISVGVVTNGTMIDHNITALAKHATWVRVSVDAATRATYQQFRPDRRGGAVFDRVIENMRLLAGVRSGSLGFSFLVITRAGPDGSVIGNHHEILSAAVLAREIGCDYFELKALFDNDHRVRSLPEDVRTAVAAQVTEARRLASPNFHLISSSTLDAVNERVDPTEAKSYHRCHVAELRTLITSSGVFVCSYHRGNRKVRLGDATQSSLADIWRRSDRRVVDPSRDCGFHCARHGSNLEIEKIAAGEVGAANDRDYDLFI